MSNNNAADVLNTIQATRTPTLLIGIGGIGGQIVRHVQAGLGEADKKYVRMLVLDTDVNALGDSISQQITTIQTSENMTVSDYLHQNPAYLDWFPSHPLINAKNLTQGAGQIRSVSRLGALSSENMHRFDIIGEAIRDLNHNFGDTLLKSMRIMIVGSVSGGTGSGMAIQLPFYIREQVERMAKLPRIIIRGMFLMSDITSEKQTTTVMKNSVHVNTYAFLRELNGFYRAQTFDSGTENLTIEHYNPPEKGIKEDAAAMSKQVPYDFLFLIENSDIHGQNVGGFDDYVERVGQIVKAQLFTSRITDNMFSIEDNLIISLVDANGMRRYCGAGISKAVYPESENMRYCILRYTESVLESYWLRADRLATKSIEQNNRQMAVDHTLRPLDPQQAYVNAFKTLTNPQEVNVDAKFGLLADEMYAEYERTNEDETVTYIKLDIAKTLLDSISAYVGSSFFNEEMEELSDKCTKYNIKRAQQSKDQAKKVVTEKLGALKNYEKKAEKRVGQLIATCIEAIMPSDESSAELFSNRTQHKYCIYTALKSKHPIVVRTILYIVKLQLQQWLTDCNNALAFKNSKEELEDTVFKKDFYDRTEKGGKNPTDSPTQAIDKSNKGLIFGGDFNTILANIFQSIDEYAERIQEVSELRLKSAVYYSVIERIDYLIEKYESFFKELETILRDRKEERINLEEDTQRIRRSDVYVCADRACKDWLFRRFKEQLTDTSDITLPEDIKTEIFTSLFNEYAKRLRSVVSDTALDLDEITMEQLFENSVICPMIEKYKPVQLGHVQMDIIEAIKLEYDIHRSLGILKAGDIPKGGPDYTADKYFIDISKQVRELARPYLSYTGAPSDVNRAIVGDDESSGKHTIGELLCFWGLNNDAVAKDQHTDKHKVDAGALKKKFGDANGATVNCVNDDSFDKKEMICYCSVYDFSIENLIKYSSSSDAYKAYTDRLNLVNKGVYSIGVGLNDYLRTVHPHLDKRWHKHSYLPELYINDDIKKCETIRKAFLIGASRCYCSFSVGDIKKRWAYGYNEIPLNDKPAYSPDYYTLLKCLDENDTVVNDLISRDEDEQAVAYDTIKLFGIDLQELLDQPIIKAFIGRTLTDEETSDFEKAFDNTSPEKGSLNILDIIFSVYSRSFNRDLTIKLVRTLADYIKGFCDKMTNNRPETSEEYMQKVCKAIGDNRKSKVNDIFRAICREVCENFFP